MTKKSLISAAMRQHVRERASGRCEYCLLHEDDMLLPHQVDHVVAEQHHGPTSLENLARSCFVCNHLKGTNIASVDPQTGQRVFLYHPRTQRWQRHFRHHDGRIEPLTRSGRATADLLQFNTWQRIDERVALRVIGRYPQ